MYGNWDGYSEAALTKPGQDVSNITVENSVLSTSISNVVRVGWPKKVFNNSNFILRDSDVLHMGIGGCGIPFALFEIWEDPGGRGIHRNYRFQNVRLEDWYSLLQLMQPNPEILNVRFQNIWAIENPSVEGSVLSGSVKGVVMDQQVCGTVGNAVQVSTGSIGLRRGRHPIRVTSTHTRGPDGFALQWQGHGVERADIPASVLWRSR